MAMIKLLLNMVVTMRSQRSGISTQDGFSFDKLYRLSLRARISREIFPFVFGSSPSHSYWLLDQSGTASFNLVFLFKVTSIHNKAHGEVNYNGIILI